MRTNQGRCLPGQGSEGGYVPGDDHGVEVAERGGCYVDADGKARYLATVRQRRLIEVVGKVGRSAAVEAGRGSATRTSPAARRSGVRTARPTWRAEPPSPPQLDGGTVGSVSDRRPCKLA